MASSREEWKEGEQGEDDEEAEEAAGLDETKGGGVVVAWVLLQVKEEEEEEEEEEAEEGRSKTLLSMLNVSAHARPGSIQRQNTRRGMTPVHCVGCV